MKIPFGDFTPMHSEIRQEMLTMFEDVYDKGWFIGGEPCERFEEHFAAYVGTRHCVACGNGLDGLLMMLVAAGIGPGDDPEPGGLRRGQKHEQHDREQLGRRWQRPLQRTGKPGI